ncbi:hypothetical protein [Sphingomonas sp.]|uniref:hypothetical protein n=1 Tax=Sphingomonas sp. TaxID=28214 RepID=UPI003AFFF9E9
MLIFRRVEEVGACGGQDTVGRLFHTVGNDGNGLADAGDFVGNRFWGNTTSPRLSLGAST